MTYLSQPPRRREREEMRAWLASCAFTHMVTLAPNQPCCTLGQLRASLLHWDAMLNRLVLGPGWQKRRDRRMAWIAFPEKLDSNPHWHLCLEISRNQAHRVASKSSTLAQMVTTCWEKAVPSGTTTTRDIYSNGAYDYVTKHLHMDRHLANFEISEGMHT